MAPSVLIPDNVEPLHSQYLDQVINVGDKVMTFTKGYSGVNIGRGTYLGIRTRNPAGRWPDVQYIVEREDGKRVALQYPRMVLQTTALVDLDGIMVG